MIKIASWASFTACVKFDNREISLGYHCPIELSSTYACGREALTLLVQMYSWSALAPKGIALEATDQDPVIHGFAYLGPHFLKLPSLFRAFMGGSLRFRDVQCNRLDRKLVIVLVFSR